MLTFGDFTGTDEADIEDMFDTGFYLRIVNNEYKKDLSKGIKVGDLPKGTRVVTQLERYIEKNPLQNQAGFNHYRPARYFVDNMLALQKSISDATLDRFENAFKSLNKLL